MTPAIASDPATSTESVTWTIVAELEINHTKNEAIRTAIDDYATVLRRMAVLLPSLPAHEWRPQNPKLYRLATREFPDEERTAHSKVVLEAQKKAAEAFQSWREQGWIPLIAPSSDQQTSTTSGSRTSSSTSSLTIGDMAFRSE